jgi:TfoX/Sxy family transcriptional regulator of competence genes
MPYNEDLERMLDNALGDLPLVKKKMFGGVAYLEKGHMFIGIVRDKLMVRVGKEKYGKYLTEADVCPMDFTGKPMPGYIYVDNILSKTADELQRWIAAGRAFIHTLPAK